MTRFFYLKTTWAAVWRRKNWNDVCVAEAGNEEAATWNDPRERWWWLLAQHPNYIHNNNLALLLNNLIVFGIYILFKL